MEATTAAQVPYWSTNDVHVDDLRQLVDTVTSPSQYPHASTVEGEVITYHMTEISSTIASPDGRREVMAEIAHALRLGPGVLVMKGAVALDACRRATDSCAAIVAQEKKAGDRTGDHFAAGSNDRLWNALEKLAISDPSTFVEYYESDAIALVSMAWLGPAYQVTSQMNVVNPGGNAQNPHRDYHLGFMTDAKAQPFPAHVHALSPLLTLQGAVAQVDMSIESGPTKLLPHSQKYEPGYLAWRNPEVMALFEQRHVQFALEAGDAVFFNPAVFHAAGANQTRDVRRMANLLQVSSAFGRAMETVDRGRMVRAVYPELLARAERWESAAIDRVIAATAEGYPFPTNLDRDTPADGLAPPSQAEVLREAIHARWSVAELDKSLVELDGRRLSR